VLITARGWEQRDVFLALVGKAFEMVRPRVAYYPGAVERYRRFLQGRSQARARSNVRTFGDARDGALPWAFLLDLDASDATEPLFRQEAFCGILSHTELADADPASFLSALTGFCNDRLWGTLNATLVIGADVVHGSTASEVSVALDQAVARLRYGTVGINTWPAVVYGSASPPWGAYPGAQPTEIQSGRGFVHNTFMLAGIEKMILSGLSTLWPKPAWFHDNRMCPTIGRRLTAFESRPRPWKFAPLVAASLRG
jgi:hypothetical protein